MNKLKCFFMLLFMCFSAYADCADQDRPVPGAFQVDISKLDLTLRNAAFSRNPEFEVNGQRFIPLEEPGGSGGKARLNLLEGGSGFVALSPGGVKFQVNNVKGKFDGKKIKFTVPFQ